MSSEPVFVVLLSNHCNHCMALLSHWHTIVKMLQTHYPSLRFPPPDPGNVYTKHFPHPPIMFIDGNIDYNLYPYDLKRYYNIWQPFIMLVDGLEWDRSYIKLGINNLARLENIQVMNSKKIGTDIVPYRFFDQNDPKSYITWIDKALHLLQSPPPPALVEKIDDQEEKRTRSKWNCSNLLNLVG